MTDRKRLELVVRCVNLLRVRIAENGGRYDGGDAPNLQSVSDLATVDDEYLIGVEDQIAHLERAVGLSTPMDKRLCSRLTRIRR